MARNSDSSEPLYLKVFAVAILAFVAIEAPDRVMGPALSATPVVDRPAVMIDATEGHIADDDGDLDRVRHFKIHDGIACGQVEASLFGETFDRTPITKSDSIVTVGCN